MTPLDAPDLPVPKRPYRSSVIFYASLSAVIVAFAAVTGGDVGTAVVVAIAFFVVATAYSWWRFRARLRLQREAQKQ